MPKYLLKPEDIELISVSDEITLFFQNKKLLIYPIRDQQIISFLKTFKECGYDETKKQYNSDDFTEIYDFICGKINTAPKTIGNMPVDTSFTSFNAIILPIAAACNLACPYCFAQSESGFNFKSYTEDDIDRIVDFLVKKASNPESPINIVFFGGEPLLKFDIIKYTVQLFKNKYPDQKVGYSITTNATIINKEIIDFFVENNFAILISLDGPDNEFNLRKFRTGEKSINKVLEAIEFYKKNKLKIEIRATFSSNNPYLFETHKFFEELQVPFIIVFAYNSENKANEELSRFNIDTQKKIESELNLVLEYYKKKLENKEPIYNQILKDTSDAIRFRIIRNIACGAGLNFFTITSNGDIFSCSHLMNDPKYKIGNIDSDEIKKEDYVAVRVDEISECQDCWVKYLCLGGCTAQKISSRRANNSSLEPNSCEFQKIQTAFMLKLYYYTTQLRPERVETTNKE